MKLYNLSTVKFNNINPQDITISIYGLGKMGLPLAATFTKHNFQVIGVDINQKIVKLTI